MEKPNLKKPEKKEILRGEDEVLAFTANDMNRCHNSACDDWQAYHEQEMAKKVVLDKEKVFKILCEEFDPTHIKDRLMRCAKSICSRVVIF